MDALSFVSKSHFEDNAVTHPLLSMIESNQRVAQSNSVLSTNFSSLIEKSLIKNDKKLELAFLED